MTSLQILERRVNALERKVAVAAIVAVVLGVGGGWIYNKLLAAEERVESLTSKITTLENRHKTIISDIDYHVDRKKQELNNYAQERANVFNNSIVNDLDARLKRSDVIKRIHETINEIFHAANGGFDANRIGWQEAVKNRTDAMHKRFEE